MTDKSLQALLGNAAADPGCDGAFELLDQYAEAYLRGDDVARLFPGFVTHLQNCVACREDAEGLIALLRGPGSPPAS